MNKDKIRFRQLSDKLFEAKLSDKEAQEMKKLIKKLKKLLRSKIKTNFDFDNIK